MKTTPVLWIDDDDTCRGPPSDDDNYRGPVMKTTAEIV